MRPRMTPTNFSHARHMRVGTVVIPRIRSFAPVFTRRDGTKLGMSRDTAAYILRMYR